jgi:hypothetical protein
MRLHMLFSQSLGTKLAFARIKNANKRTLVNVIEYVTLEPRDAHRRIAIHVAILPKAFETIARFLRQYVFGLDVLDKRIGYFVRLAHVVALGPLTL